MTFEERKKYTCCFTGHRKIPQSKFRKIKKRLKKAVTTAIKSGYRYFVTGGALGFDTFAAQTVLELKKKHPDIRLILVLPCLSQTANWHKNDIYEYERIKSNADKVVYTSKEYTQNCMFKRNRQLVNYSNLCICYLTKQSGGTAYTVEYAHSKGLKIKNIAFD